MTIVVNISLRTRKEEEWRFHRDASKKVGNHWSKCLGPGPSKVGQGVLKFLQLWRHSLKISNPQPKHFFHWKLQDLPSLLTGWTAL